VLHKYYDGKSYENLNSKGLKVPLFQRGVKKTVVLNIIAIMKRHTRFRPLPKCLFR